MNINEQVRKIMADAGFSGAVFAQFLNGVTYWSAYQSGLPSRGYRARRNAEAETPEAAIAACMAAQWVMEKEEAK